MSIMRAELTRRQSLTDAVEAHFRARPYVWHTALDLSDVGGRLGSRTRISECRTKRGMTIEHNGRNGARSAYRFLPQAPLGRDAGTLTEPVLFDL